VALAISEVRGIVERACARPDVLDACARRDLGTVITVLKSLGVAQGQIAELTGISQGRLSEWATGKRKPTATSTFESFADGLGLPPAARLALGLAPGSPAVSGLAVPHSREAPKLDIGLEYPSTPAQAARNVSALWQADLSDQQAVERGLITPAAWNEASLRWLVAPSVIPGDAGDMPGGVRVGMGDVERFRDTVGMFRELDDRFGGGARTRRADPLPARRRGPAAARPLPRHGRQHPAVRGRRGHLAGRVDDLRQHAAQPAGAAVLHPGARPGPAGRRPAARRGDPGRDEPPGHLHRPLPGSGQPRPGSPDRHHRDRHRDPDRSLPHHGGPRPGATG
jgi:transcriptional regulator with XRE-family HTH domain